MRRRLAFITVFLAFCFTGRFAAAEAGASGGTRYPSAESKIRALMDAAGARFGAVKDKFGQQDAKGEKRRVDLSPAESKLIADACADFFKGLADSSNGPSLNREHLQSFRQNFLGGEKAWGERFMAVERALMMGRAQMVKDLWSETIADYAKAHPGDAALLVGQVDIGSWVDMKLGGLSFPADIDFSSVAVDVRVNETVVRMFEDKLIRRAGQNMVDADTLLTPHGSATAHVFIGDWGKAYAEMELLRPDAVVKVLEHEGGEYGKLGELKLDAEGKPIFKPMKGSHLFWEIAFAKGSPVEYPKFDLTKEPMATLEMWRHEKHDVAQGPFSDAQKLMKVMKYLERANYVNEKALAAFRSSLPGGDSDLNAFAVSMIDAKRKKLSGAEIEKLVADYAKLHLGETLNQGNYGQIVNRIEAKAQTAMMDNAAKAISCRFKQMAGIKDDAERGAALQKFWSDLDVEMTAIRRNRIPVPDFIEQACSLAKRVQDGNLPPEALIARANELRKLLEDGYKLEPSEIDRILNYDAYAALSRYFKEKIGWPDERIQKVIADLRKKHPNAAAAYDKITQFNEEWNQTLEGSLVLKSLDFLDDAVEIYDGLMSGRNYAEGAVNATKAILWSKAAGKFPVLNVGNACWEAYKEGDPTPALKSVAFYFFPTVGAFWGLGEKCQRLDAAANDENFFRHVVMIRDACTFNAQGHMTSVKISGALDALDIPAAAAAAVRAKAFVDYFLGHDDLNMLGSGNPAIRYWATLIPREAREYGMSGKIDESHVARKYDLTGYVKKMRRLREFFPYGVELTQITRLLEDIRSRPLPEDKYKDERNRRITDFEDLIEKLVWRSLFDILEASADPDLDKMREELEKLEFALCVCDVRLGRDQGITSRAKAEIAAQKRWLDGGHKFADKFVYTRYLEAYRRVKAIQSELILLWTKEFGVDWAAITTVTPLKGLLDGSQNSAPRLTGQPERDVAIAEACLAAHRKRKEAMIEILEYVVRRPVDSENDFDLLQRIAQIEFEREHLLDNCPERRISQGTVEEKAAEVERKKRLGDLLNEIRAENYRFLVVGKTSYQVGDSVELTVKAEGLSDKNRSLMRYVWSDNLGRTERVAFKAEKPGKRTVSFKVFAPVKGKMVPYGESAPFTFEVKTGNPLDENPDLKLKLEILAKDKAVLGEKIPLAVKTEIFSSEQAARYRFKWHNDTDKISLGRGRKTFSIPKYCGSHVIRLEACLLDVAGKETKVAEAVKKIEIVPVPTAIPTRFLPGVSTAKASAPIIHAPKEAQEGSPFEISVELPPELRAKAKHVSCYALNCMEPYADGLLPEKFTFYPMISGRKEPYAAKISVRVYDKFENKTVQVAAVPATEYEEVVGFDKSSQKKITRKVTRPGQAAYTRVVLDANICAEAQTQIFLKPSSLSVRLPAGWVGGAGEAFWARLEKPITQERKYKALNLDSGKEEEHPTVSSCNVRVSCKQGPMWAPDHYRTRENDPLADYLESIDRKLAFKPYVEKFCAVSELEKNQKKIVVKPFQAGDFSGHMRETPFRFTPSSPAYIASHMWQGGKHAHAVWQAYFMVFKGNLCYSISCVAEGTGFWDGKDDEFVKTTVGKLQQQALSVVQSMTIRPFPVVSGVSSEETPSAAPPLTADIIKVDRTTVHAGEDVNLTAAASGGKPPYVFAWTGASASGDVTAKAQPKTPGDCPVSVRVTDADGKSAWATVTIKVSAPAAVLSGLPKKVTVGQKLSITATVKPADGDYRYVWNADGGERPAPADDAANILEYAFTELGETKFWVEVLRNNGKGHYGSYTESHQVLVTVEPPKFNVSFEPADAKPGDEVLARVTAFPDSVQPLLEYRWETPESANRWVYADSESVIGFKLKDAKPVTIKASATFLRSVKEVGQVVATYSPSAYVVNAVLVGPANQGPRPMVWSNKAGGLVPVDKTTFAPDETALLRAEIKPANDKVRWRWTANEGTTVHSSELSREIRVSRHEPGTGTLTVTAADPDGIQLGSASVSFTVAATPTVVKPAPLVVTLSAEKEKMRVGESAWVKAAVSGGRPPYRFSWNGDHQGEGQATNFVAFRPGLRKLYVQATDFSGKTASAVTAFEVEPKLLKLSFTVKDGQAEENTIRVAADAVATITLTPEGGKPPYQVVWTGPVTGTGLSVTCKAPAKISAVVTDSAQSRGEIELEVKEIESLIRRR